MYLKEACYKMGVNHPKKIFFEILKNFGLFKQKKMCCKMQHFQKKSLQQTQHFQQMLISQQKMNIAKLMSKYMLFPHSHEFLIVPLEKS